MLEYRPMDTIRIRTEKLIFGGQALAKLEGKTCFVWNALPGEEVTARMPQETLTGIFKGIDQSGALQLQMPDGAVKTINSAEVFV